MSALIVWDISLPIEIPPKNTAEASGKQGPFAALTALRIFMFLSQVKLNAKIYDAFGSQHAFQSTSVVMILVPQSPSHYVYQHHSLSNLA